MPATGDKTAITAVDRYVSIDIQTTGLDPAKDRIVMLAAVRVVNGRSIGKFKSLIDPIREGEKRPASMKKLEGAPKIETILPAFLAFVGDDVIVGHNMRFAAEFLDGVYRAKLGNDFSSQRIDTQELAQLIYPHSGALSVEELHEKLFDKPADRKSDSKADIAARCFEFMKLQLRKNGIGTDEADDENAAEPENPENGQPAAVEDTEAQTGDAPADDEPETQPEPEPEAAETAEAEAEMTEAERAFEAEIEPQPVQAKEAGPKPEETFDDEPELPDLEEDDPNDDAATIEKAFQTDIADCRTTGNIPFIEAPMEDPSIGIRRRRMRLSILLILLTFASVAMLIGYAIELDKRFLIGAACIIPLYIVCLVLLGRSGARDGKKVKKTE